MPEVINFGHLFFSMQLDLFSISENNSRQNIKLDELFEAYYNCRKNKRNTINALAFEIDYEKT